MNNEISLRDKKFAKTRFSIMQEFLRQLETKKFEEISINDVCKHIDISEGTFFNYFPKKIDVIFFLKTVIMLKIRWLTEERSKNSSYLSRLDNFFEVHTEVIAKKPKIISELMAIFLREDHEDCFFKDIQNFEKKFIFPDYIEIEKIPLERLEVYFHNVLKQALENKELPEKTNINDLNVSLATIFIGLMLSHNLFNFEETKRHYKNLLGYIWKGVGRINYE